MTAAYTGLASLELHHQLQGSAKYQPRWPPASSQTQTWYHDITTINSHVPSDLMKIHYRFHRH